MTVPVGSGRSTEWIADGANRNWDFPFKVLSAGHIALEVVDLLGNVETVTSGFTVAGVNSEDGGTVTYPVAPAAPLAPGLRLTVVRALPLSQPERIGNQGGFHAETHERALDRVVMLLQQVDENGPRRGVLVPRDEAGVVLPSLAGRAGKVLAFDENGLPVARTSAATGSGIGDADVDPAAAIAASKLSFRRSGTGFSEVSVQAVLDRAPLSPFDFEGASLSIRMQAALAKAFELGGGKVKLPAGKLAFTQAIDLSGAYSSTTDGTPVQIEGEGGATVLYHDFDGPLFTCDDTLASFVSAKNFTVVSRSPKSAGAPVFLFSNGLTRSVFENIRVGFTGAGNNPAGFFDCGPASTTDTISFNEIFVEALRHRGIGIGKGSSIYINGGRFVGDNFQGVGLELYGGNGGVWTWAADFIHLATGVRITSGNGETNREIFFSQAAFDANYISFFASDASYINIEGLWAASARDAIINLSGDFIGNFTVNGGTVFNAGAVAGGAGDGIVINGGERVVIDNVIFRNNAGTALKCPNNAQPAYGKLTGCVFAANGTGFFAGGDWDVSDNSFIGNTTAAAENGATLRFSNNRGVNDPAALTSPTLPASNVEYTYTGNFPAVVFIRNGTVQSVWLDGQPIYENGTNVQVPIRKGQKIKIVYTAAPNWIWFKQ